MRSYHRYFIVVPLLVLIWGCGPSGSIRLDSGTDVTEGSDITSVVKVSGTRGTVQFDVSENVLYTSGIAKCMDKVYGDEWKDAASFDCSSVVDLTPGETQAITLTGLLPDKSYLVRFYASDVSSSAVKAASSETLLSYTFEISTTMSEVYSKSWRLSMGFSCDTGDINGDGLVDILCGGTAGDVTGESPQVGLMLGTGSVPAMNFDIVKFTADPVNGSAPGWCNKIEDINGDGHDDLIVGDWRLKVGAWYDGAVYIFYGPLSVNAGEEISLTTADQIIPNPKTGMQFFGESCAYHRDMNWFLIAWSGYSYEHGNCNSDPYCGGIGAYQWDGEKMAAVAGTSPILKDYGEMNAKLGAQMSIGDYDGDGKADLHYQFTRNGVNGANCRDTKLILGSSPAPPGTDLHIATSCLPENGSAFLMTNSDFIDVNQDGYDDFIVYEIIVEPVDNRITIYFGGTTVEPARSQVFTSTDQLRFAASVGDVNNDGLAELVLSGSLDFLIYSIGDGAIGAELGEMVGRGMLNAYLEDLNNDGYNDFINVGFDWGDSAYFVIRY